MVSFPFNTQIPATNDDPGFDQPIMQQNSLSTSNLISVDHVGFVNNFGGSHARVQLQNISNPGGVPAGGYGNGFLTLFSDVVNGLDQLFMVRDAGGTPDRIQLTGPFSPTINLSLPTDTGYTFLPGGILIQWGLVSQSFSSGQTNGSTNFPISFPNNVLIVNATPTVTTATPPSSAGTISIRKSYLGASTTDFGWIFYSNSSQYLGFNWMAIGY